METLSRTIKRKTMKSTMYNFSGLKILITGWGAWGLLGSHLSWKFSECDRSQSHVVLPASERLPHDALGSIRHAEINSRLGSYRPFGTRCRFILRRSRRAGLSGPPPDFKAYIDRPHVITFMYFDLARIEAPSSDWI
jgi:hypothetical protein